MLDPFAGTGTTAQAAMLEGFKSILIEREAEYVNDIKERIKHVIRKPVFFNKLKPVAQPKGRPKGFFGHKD